jgi:tRNA(fMet)-specific endonuclease VapC
MEIVLMDTDFVYEYFSQNAEAVNAINENSDNHFIIGFTTAAELVKTAYNKEKLDMLNATLHKSKLEVLHIDEDISEKALELIQQYHLSHAASIADMLLAATALKYNCQLATCNKKHFQHIPELKLFPHNVTPTPGGFLGLFT